MWFLTLHHQVRRHQAPLPGGGHRPSHLVPGRTVRLRNGTGIHPPDLRDFHVRISRGLPQIDDSAVYGIFRVQADIRDHGGLRRNYVGSIAPLHLGKGHRFRQMGLEQMTLHLAADFGQEPHLRMRLRRGSVVS